MNELKHGIETALVNKSKLIYIPLIIGLSSIIIVSLLSYNLSKNLLIEYMKEDGISLSKQMAMQIEGNSDSLALVNNMIEEKIETTGTIVNINRRNLGNNLLKRIAKDVNVDEISWYSPEGKLIYSNIDSYVGWKIIKGHPVYNFKMSGKKNI